LVALLVLGREQLADSLELQVDQAFCFLGGLLSESCYAVLWGGNGCVMKTTIAARSRLSKGPSNQDREEEGWESPCGNAFFEKHVAK